MTIKITMDGRKIGGTDQVVFGLVPILKNHLGVTQNPFFYVPILIVNEKESKELFKSVVELYTPQMSKEFVLGTDSSKIDYLL